MDFDRHRVAEQNSEYFQVAFIFEIFLVENRTEMDQKSFCIFPSVKMLKICVQKSIDWSILKKKIVKLNLNEKNSRKF